MTIACPLCANTNEVLSQPSSIGWKQVACSSCEVNLVLVREPSSGAPRRPLTSAIRLMSPLSGARPRAAIVRSRLFLVVATVFAFGVLGYLFWEMGLFESYASIESNAPPSAVPVPLGDGQ